MAGPQPLPAFALPRTGEFAALSTTGTSGLPSFALPSSSFANGAGRPTPLPTFSSPFALSAARSPLPAFQAAPARSALPAFSLRDDEPASDAPERLFGPDENTRQKPLSVPPAPSSRSSFQAPLSIAPLSRPSAPLLSATDPSELSTARIAPHPAFARGAAALAAPGESTPAASVVLSVPPTPLAPRMPSPRALAATDLSVARAGAAPIAAQGGEAASEVTVNPPPAGVAPSADPLVGFVASAKQVLARRVHPRGPSVQAVLAAVTPVLVILGVFLSGPSTGQLRVNTTAKTDGRVDVFVDGRKVCEAVPCVVEELEPGERTVRVMADGYDPAPAVTVEVHSGAEVVAHVPLGEPERAATTTVQPTAIPTVTLGVILPATQRLR
ncbi:MAG: PEGA domain-containing protein [Polyangiaceae bacterium]